MSYNLSAEEINEFITSPDQDNQVIYELPKKLGFIKSSKEILNEDILIFKNNMDINSSLKINSKMNVSGLVITIITNGNLLNKDNTINKEESFKKNQINIKYINQNDSEMIFNTPTKYESIGILIKNNFLEKYLFNKIDNIEEIKNNYKQNITSSIYSNDKNQNSIFLAKEIINSPFNQDLQSLFLQSKVYEIIYNQFSNILSLDKKKDTHEIKLTQDDLNALYKAKEIIETTDNVLNITKLSKLVVINEFKLKYGFKKLFNCSPGAMILNQKMNKAKELLQTSELSIEEISSKIGYKYQQSFTVAFIKHFGLRPKDIMKNRKYYY